MSQQFKATLIGFSAIVWWGCLAFLTDINRLIPAFQLMAMSFTLGFVVIAIKWLLNGQSPLWVARQSVGVWALTLLGLFGYHFFYFMALKHAPVLQAGLVAYLWPLFIVVFATVLFNRPVSRWLIVGAVVSLLGCWLLIYREDMLMSREHLLGYGFALACALIWSLYSVLSSKVSDVSSDFIGWGCGATALLALICHVLLESTFWPLSTEQWLCVIALGFGPVGLAFVAWDHGMKKGNVALLGSLSYLAPLISTVILVWVADKPVTGQLLLGGSLVLFGAISASLSQGNKAA